MTAEAVLSLIGGEGSVRNYLRGIEEGSETDKDAQRSMLAAISGMRAGGVYGIMAQWEPALYAQACLLMCRLWVDAEDGKAPEIIRQYNSIVLQLRYDERNVEGCEMNG